MIEVRIPKAEVNALGVVGGRRMVQDRLFAAHIPFSFGLGYPVERGKLTHFVDDLFDELVYQWEPG